MLAKTLESIQSSEIRRVTYIRWILALFAIFIAVKTAFFSRWGIWHTRDLVDFDVFHIIAQRVWLGDVDQAYRFAKLVNMQREASGGVDSFMPWTYPPQFSLLLSPLALMPTGLAYLLFTGSTLALYLVVLHSIAGRNLLLVIIVLFPAIQITMACGQNGFLTAALIGAFCLFIEERPTLAGLALGLMVIKPHLAVAFAAYSILKRHWTTVVTAASVVLASSALCTLVFGVEIWTALLQSVHDSSMFLERGYYPLFRMISFYASLRTVGFSGPVAFVGQALIATLALGVVGIFVHKRMPLRTTLGLTAMVSVCISPYAYDYDLPIVGVGFALLLPELQAVSREDERGIVYAALMLAGAYGSLRGSGLSSRIEISTLDVISISGFLIVPLIALVLLILLRRQNTAAAPDRLGQTEEIAFAGDP